MRGELKKLLETQYLYDAEHQIWHRAGAASFCYSDGEEVEKRIGEIIKNTKDLSSISEELNSQITDWASRYHLSSQRVDLLRPVRHLIRGRVLEIGAGCGALTRYLGETGVQVVALEGSGRRAAIAAQRCRDLSNVHICCESFQHFDIPDRFDVVTLIGVLEYSRLYMGGADPVTTMLKRAAEFLREDGVLILAIENQLGLKYLAGAPEDHVGQPFYGINDLYGRDTVVTFGRRELEGLLQRAGFASYEFLYPLPDYKFPVIILHPAALSDPHFNVASLIRTQAASNQASDYIRLFSEEMVWPLLARNGLVEDLANSFLTIARKSAVPLEVVDKKKLAYLYTPAGRHVSLRRAFSNGTTMVFAYDGCVFMIMRRLRPICHSGRSSRTKGFWMASCTPKGSMPS